MWSSHLFQGVLVALPDKVVHLQLSRKKQATAPYPSIKNDLHISIATGLHENVPAQFTIFTVLTRMLFLGVRCVCGVCAVCGCVQCGVWCGVCVVCGVWCGVVCVVWHAEKTRV